MEEARRIVFSCIIPASKNDLDSQNLKDLIASIKAQDFPQDQIEILVITEGDSEQAKAIGIRRAKGEICAMFCADNYLIDKTSFSEIYNAFNFNVTGAYSKHYAVVKSDNSLNRYFSLMGNNDPIAFYLGKCDRKPWYEVNQKERHTVMDFRYGLESLGDNGFFYRRKHLLESDLDHYYPMDNAEDLNRKGMSFYIRTNQVHVWHRTTNSSLISFLIRRYRYARDLYCDRNDRRWKMLDTREDYWRLVFFVIATLTVIQPLSISLRGWFKIRDRAWFWHPLVAFGFLITYTILAFRNLFRYGNFFQRRQDEILCQNKEAQARDVRIKKETV